LLFGILVQLILARKEHAKQEMEKAVSAKENEDGAVFSAVGGVVILAATAITDAVGVDVATTTITTVAMAMRGAGRHT
uniref:DUF92 domain-containing protein n=1 Tax=Schistocephalus solidus TaxID=70667 RepID=A0A183SCT7_SCHSO